LLPEEPKAFIIGLSAYSSDVFKQKSILCGMNDYSKIFILLIYINNAIIVTKPIDNVDDLQKVLEKTGVM
jgi:hypothetical protein